MIILKDSEKQKRIERWLDVFSLGAVLQYTVYRFLQSTMFTFFYSNTYKMMTLALLVCFGGIRYTYIIVKRWKEQSVTRKKIFFQCAFVWCLALPFFYVGWRHDYKFLFFLPICCMCLYDMSVEKIFKAYFYTIATLLAATVLCSLAGTVRNLVYTLDDGRVVCAYGIINTTDFASYVIFLLLIYWCGLVRHARSISIFYSIITIAISFLVYWCTDSRTALNIGALSVAFFLWDCIEENVLQQRTRYQWVRKSINYLSVIAFPLIGLLAGFLIWRFGQHDSWALQLDSLLSSRLHLSYESYQTYGIHPLGAIIESMHGRGGTLIHNWDTGYSYLDIAYAMLTIRYGWVITSIVTVIWVWTTVRSLRTRNNRIAFAMAILAVHAFSEARILDINYNIFLVIPFCALQDLNQRQESKLHKTNTKMWIPVYIGISIFGISFLLLPRVLSQLRTFFALQEWNKGLAAFKSLIVCIGIVLFLLILHKGLCLLIKERNKRAVIITVLTLLLGAGGFFTVSGMINAEVIAHSERLDVEEDIVRLVQTVAKQPVYAAEPSELYAKRFGTISDHIFSTDELNRIPKGSIFTDQNTEALGIISTGGFYTTIDEKTGFYSYDEAVIKALAEAGFNWTPYYSEKHVCNLMDIAVFNEIRTDQPLTICGPKRIITTNCETDQYKGKYKVSFVLSGFSGSEDGVVATLEVLGDAGEKQIISKEVLAENFDSNGLYVCEIEYHIESTPKVSYAISINKDCQLTVEEISWQQFLLTQSDEIVIKADESIEMHTSIPGNKFNLVHFQLHDVMTEKYLLSFGEGDKPGEISGSYIHNEKDGLFYLRIKGNTKLADEWIRTILYLETGDTIHYSYKIDEFDSSHIVVSNLEIDKNGKKINIFD